MVEDVFPGKFPASKGTFQDETQQPVKGDGDGPPRILSGIESPADLKQLSRAQLGQLCQEIRDHIIAVISRTGGHLGASLGVVELTVALEMVLDLPQDRLVWDVGHQAYVHKVLTGRREQLPSIRQLGGISGFLKRQESRFDAFGAGHASTAISAALGMAAARDLGDEDHRVVAVIGDGAMTGGLAYEAMNNAGLSGRKLMVVLNDNGMSIAPNVGALAQHLTSIRTNPLIRRLREDTLNLVERLPALGEPMGELAKRIEGAVKSAITEGGLFEALGFKYIGPVDGHDLDQLLELLPKLVDREQPVLLHVLTEKGRGLPRIDKKKESFHAVVPFDLTTGADLSKGPKPETPSYTQVFADAMIDSAEEYSELVAITAAMTSGTGLGEFKKRFPERFFDVGIAEAHAVCFAAGLACDGARPVVAVYSTFLQRAYDQICHDVALQGLPVIFALDRGGLVGSDGPTHHGLLDLSFLRSIPGITLAAPRDGNELRDMLWTALHQTDGPFAFRYPRGAVPAGFDPARPLSVLPIGKWEMLEPGEDITFLAVGAMVQQALDARTLLAERGISASVVNCRFVNPLDRQMLSELRKQFPVMITLEDNVLAGGFGSAVLESLSTAGLSLDGVVRRGLPAEFVTQGTREQLLELVGLTPAQIADTARQALKSEKQP
jgi:1-deoxy-D-xylulose-5-phosphate synthase